MKKARVMLPRFWGYRVLIAAAVSVLLLIAQRTLYARFDEADAVQINPDEIEDATLAVGTHLIYLSEVEEEIYGLAKESAEESGQSELYYKSELGNGAWYLVSQASSLSDITKEAGRIDSQKIKDLFFTYHTRSDGITYDLKTNQPVNVYDIQKPYDLQSLSELDALRTKLETMKKGGADTSVIDTFFEAEIENEETKALDEQMAVIYAYETELKVNGASKEILEMVQKVMKKVDAARRYEADGILLVKLNDLMDLVSSDSSLSVQSDLLEVLGNAIKEVQSSVDGLEAERLYTGGEKESDLSAISDLEQSLTEEFLTALESGDGTAVDSVLKELSCLYRIVEGRSTKTEEEKAFLDNRLLPKAAELYESTGDESIKNELEYYQKRRAQMDEVTAGETELNTLYEEKQKLQELRLSALDKENLTEAKKQEVFLEEVDKKIQELEAAGIYGETSASQTISDIKTEMLEMLEDTENYSQEKLSADLEGISAVCSISPQAAKEALEEICRKLQAMQAMLETPDAGYEALLSQIETILSENLPLFHGTMDSDTILEAVEEVDGASLLAKSSQIPDAGGSSAAEESAAAIAGLAMFCEQTEPADDSEVSRLLKAQSERLSGDGSSYVFQKPQGAFDGNYVPVDKLSAFLSFRYVWKENQKQAVLAAKGTYYRFTAFSNKVELAKGETKDMDSSALFQSVLYLPAEYVEQEFGCLVYVLSDTGYSVLLDTASADAASEVCDAILLKGGM